MVAAGIAAAIANYKATEAGSPDTTIGNTLAALAELTRKKGRAYEKAVARLADDHSAVDDVTLTVLRPLASATLAANPARRKRSPRQPVREPTNCARTSASTPARRRCGCFAAGFG